MKALNGVLFGEDKTSGVMNLDFFFVSILCSLAFCKRPTK
jgi:hypothetical protein